MFESKAAKNEAIAIPARIAKKLSSKDGMIVEARVEKGKLTIIIGYGKKNCMETILKRRRQELRLNRHKAVLLRVKAAVDFLYREGTKEVYLFGSITNPEKFTENSDVDFFVKGIDEERHLEIEGKIEDILSDVEYDILFCEEEKEIRKEILDRIKKEAVLWKPSFSI